MMVACCEHNMVLVRSLFIVYFFMFVSLAIVISLSYLLFQVPLKKQIILQALFIIRHSEVEVVTCLVDKLVYVLLLVHLSKVTFG